MKVDCDKQRFITTIANMISEKTIKRIHNLKDEIEGYLDHHLEAIIMLGLGITCDSWNSFQFERMNGFTGLLVEYITTLARADAEKRVEGLLKQIVEVRDKEMLSKGAGDSARHIYIEQYRHTLGSLIQEHLQARENEFREQLTPVINETGLRLRVMASDQLQALITSVNDAVSKTKAAK